MISINGFVHETFKPVFDVFDNFSGLLPVALLVILNIYLLIKIIKICQGEMVRDKTIDTVTNKWFSWAEYEEYLKGGQGENQNTI